jgi:hypothetical protein
MPRSAKTDAAVLGLRRSAAIAMMQATDFGNLYDVARLGKFDRSEVRRILVERKMGASVVIVLKVARQDAAKMAFAKDENMVQRLSADRANEALSEGILPRCAARSAPRRFPGRSRVAGMPDRMLSRSRRR